MMYTTFLELFSVVSIGVPECTSFCNKATTVLLKLLITDLVLSLNS